MKYIDFGYCRISTKKQSLERQERNIIAESPNAIIVKETYTGTTISRKEWNKLLKLARHYKEQGYHVRIIFDSVSRMSRTAEDGFKLYEELFYEGIELVFLKEHHIDTRTYREAIESKIQMTGTNADILLKAVQEYLMVLAKEQIKLAFEQAEKEVIDLRQRTSEGLMTARLNGKQIGRKRGSTYITQKEKLAREIILNKSKDFYGSNTDSEVMAIANISRNSFYKYKAALKAEIA